MCCSLAVHDALAAVLELHGQHPHRKLCIHVVWIELVESIQKLRHELICFLGELEIVGHLKV